MKISVINKDTVKKKLSMFGLGLASLAAFLGLTVGSYFVAPRLLNEGMYYSRAGAIEEKILKEAAKETSGRHVELALEDVHKIRQEITALSERDYLVNANIISPSIEELTEQWEEAYANRIRNNIISFIGNNDYIAALELFEGHQEDMKKGKFNVGVLKTNIDSIHPEKILENAKNSTGKQRLEHLLRADKIYDKMNQPSVELKEAIFSEYVDYLKTFQTNFDDASEFAGFLEFKKRIDAFNEGSERKARMHVEQNLLDSYFSSSEAFMSRPLNGHFNRMRLAVERFLDTYSLMITMFDKEHLETRINDAFEKFHVSVCRYMAENQDDGRFSWAEEFEEQAKKYKISEERISAYLASIYYSGASGSQDQNDKKTFLNHCLFYARKSDDATRQDFTEKIADIYYLMAANAVTGGELSRKEKSEVYMLAEHARNLYEQIGKSEEVKKIEELQAKLLKAE